MRRLHPLLFWVALSCCAVYAQDTRGAGTVSSFRALVGAQETEPLRLTANISGQEYCDNDHLRMSIRLAYKNVGRQPLILYKYSIVAPRYFVSRDVKSAEVGSYLKDITPMMRPIMPGPRDVPLPGGDSVFVILKPGESYSPEIETSVNLLNIRDRADGSDSSLHPGDYVIEIVVQTWYDSRELAETLSERWQQFGSLWTKPIKSQPLPFKIDKERKVATCSGK
jgi:hypothetical protein